MLFALVCSAYNIIASYLSKNSKRSKQIFKVLLFILAIIKSEKEYTQISLLISQHKVVSLWTTLKYKLNHFSDSLNKQAIFHWLCNVIQKDLIVTPIFITR